MIMKNFSSIDIDFMKQALLEAKKAGENNEVPIGAVLHFPKDDISFSAGNKTITDCDVTSHAEILCLKQASIHYQNHRLVDSTLYVTLEPCIMCLGALLQARVKKIFIAARDSRDNSIHKHIDLYKSPYFNHQIKTSYGLMEKEAETLLRSFFNAKRN